ncbi:MAG: nucleotidyltransferase [Ignavibacteria bacterium]|nr:nucleotidyltransferase [Ignavibacteria bacterium]
MNEEIMDKDSILQLIRANRNIIEGKGVISVALFGSFSTNRFTDSSDIDLMINFQNGLKNFDNFMDLAFYLEDLFGRKVELVTPESVSDAFLSEISKEMIYAY